MRLLAEREERVGRRFGDPSVKLETEVWLRRRDELFAKARNFMTAESFATAGRVLDELAEHLEDGAPADEELAALRQTFQHALVESSEKMRREIAAAHAQENIVKTRRLLSMYDARFGQERRSTRRSRPPRSGSRRWTRCGRRARQDRAVSVVRGAAAAGWSLRCWSSSFSAGPSPRGTGRIRRSRCGGG